MKTLYLYTVEIKIPTTRTEYNNFVVAYS